MPAKILRIQFEKNIDENNILAGEPLHQRGSSEPPAVVQFIVRRKNHFLVGICYCEHEPVKSFYYDKNKVKKTSMKKINK